MLSKVTRVMVTLLIIFNMSANKNYVTLQVPY
jgi:hypothetical protein